MSYLTHNASKTNEYRLWLAMKQRCYNPKSHNYKNWGGRGITVCDEWKNSFENFIKDVGLRPSSKHSLDRIDNSKGYTKENCKWSTWFEQGAHRRSNRNITYKDQTKTISEWARIYKITPHTISYRLKNNWSIEKTLNTPVIERTKRKIDKLITKNILKDFNNNLSIKTISQKYSISYGTICEFINIYKP